MPRMPRPKIDRIVKEIGLRIARFRTERGISQSQLAAHLGLSQANVSSYERGIIRLPSDMLIQIAQLLKISTDALLGLKVSEPSPPLHNRKLLQYLALAERLPKRDRDALMRTVRLYLSRTEGVLDDQTGAPKKPRAKASVVSATPTIEHRAHGRSRVVGR